MKPKYWAILSVGALILAGCGAKPATVASNALKAGTEEERIRAAAQLTKFKGPIIAKEVVPELRRLVTESKDPAVLVIAIDGLVAFNDGQSILLFYTAMDHPEQSVREAAYNGVQKIFGGALPEKLKYQVDDPPEKRALVTSRLRKIHQETLDLKEKQKALIP